MMEHHNKTDREGASNNTVPPTSPLWFLQDSLDEDDLTPQQIAAVHDLITPLYERLVLSEKDELSRATGNVVVFNTMIETLMQPAVLAALRDAIRDPEHKPEVFEAEFGRYLDATRERHRQPICTCDYGAPITPVGRDRSIHLG